MIRSIFGFLTRPGLVIVCALILLFDWSLLPDTPIKRSRCAKYCPISLRGNMTGHAYPVQIDVYRTPMGLRARPRFVNVPKAWEDLGVVILPPQTTDTGFWGLTSHIRSGVLLLGTEQLTQNERDQLPDVIIRAIEGEPDGPNHYRFVYDILKAGNAAATSRLIGGYIHNVIAIILAAITIVGCPRLVSSAIRHLLEAKNERLIGQRMDHGMCPRCGYDLQRNFTSNCSECGWVPGTRA